MPSTVWEESQLSTDEDKIRKVSIALRMISGQCPHTGKFRLKSDCVTCLAERAIEALDSMEWLSD